MNEFETVIILSKHARIHKLSATVWTNDSVVLNMLIRLGATYLALNYYELPLEQFAILPKQKAKEIHPVVVYPDVLVLPNDNLDKETAINFTQDERKKKILHITTEDEYFITRCKKYNLPYKDGSFLSRDDFRPFGKRAKLEEIERAARSERMREARRLGMLHS